MRFILTTVLVGALLCVACDDGSYPGPSCCRVCRSSCACGDSCIPCSNTCHAGVGCACNGMTDEAGDFWIVSSEWEDAWRADGEVE